MSFLDDTLNGLSKKTDRWYKDNWFEYLIIGLILLFLLYIWSKIR